MEGLEFLVRFNLYVTYLTVLHVSLAGSASRSDLELPAIERGSQRFLEMANSESLQKLFSRIRFHKHDDFPSLLQEKNGTTVKIPPSEILSWQNSADSWFAAHGASGTFELANIWIILSEDGGSITPMSPAYADPVD